jgi:hypothetical protein
MKRTAALLALATVLSSLQSLAQPTSEIPKAWGMAANGLRIAISPVKTGTLPAKGAEFDVTFENVGDKDFVLNLGNMIATGSMLLPEKVRLVLADPKGKTTDLKFFDKKPSGMNWINDLIIPLPAKMTYVLHLSLSQCLPPGAKEPGLRLTPGNYRIAAKFESGNAKSNMKGLPPAKSWSGTLQSGWLDFEIGWGQN